MHVEVSYRGGELFAVGIDGYRLAVDAPPSAGGHGLGPTPAGLMVASVAADAAARAKRFLHDHGLPAGGLRVEANARLEPGHTRPVRLCLLLPASLTAQQRQALHRTVVRGGGCDALPATVEVELTVIADRLVGV